MRTAAHWFSTPFRADAALPRVLNFNLERLKRKQMESEIEYLHNEVQRLTKELDEANATISSLSRVREGDTNLLFTRWSHAHSIDGSNEAGAPRATTARATVCPGRS
jgi:hypothetical protein